MTPLVLVMTTNVYPGDLVKISIQNDPTKHSEGKVSRILSDGSGEEVIVVLKNGDRGNVISVINSVEVIKERIMLETQYSENKLNCLEEVMKTEVIPKTVQSFLNAEGGYLYVGIADTGELHERLVGLADDFKSINEPNLPMDEICDVLVRKIRDSLGLYLTSEVEISPLLEFNFRDIEGTQILEIKIEKSPAPFFFRHLTKQKKPKQFELYFNNKPAGQHRILDDFYIRIGNAKKSLDTHQEFYEYIKSRFANL